MYNYFHVLILELQNYIKYFIPQIYSISKYIGVYFECCHIWFCVTSIFLSFIEDYFESTLLQTLIKILEINHN